MIRKLLWALLLPLLLLPAAAALPAQLPGAPGQAPVDSPEVRAAAAFAVQAQGRAMQGAAGTAPVRLELVAILGADRQSKLGSGLNTVRLDLKGL